MGRKARGELMDPSQVQVFHCIHRCVRRAFLCGNDPYSGITYDHRREWIRARLEFLASVFAIDCLTYTIMSNHLHQVLRSRPDLVEGWSDEEVARRWLRLFPRRRDSDGSPAEPTEPEIDFLVNDPDRIQERRRRMSDISWWARCTAENIARLSNQEDNVTGHFWEGRYKSDQLDDEADVLACAAYVDLNPIRAALADRPETCTFTGARDRIDDLRLHHSNETSDPDWERLGVCQKSGWMSPIEIVEHQNPAEQGASAKGRRASEKGFLAVSLRKYLELLDWTGRQLSEGKRGQIPDHLASILDRLGLNSTLWCDLVSRFGRGFRCSLTAVHLRPEVRSRRENRIRSPDCLT